MKNLTWQNPEQLFVAQELINKVKSKCCGIKVFMDFETYLNAKDEKECLRVLAISFLKVLEELKYPGKVKKFEREKFNQAVKEFFIKENIISEADIDCKQSE